MCLTPENMCLTTLALCLIACYLGAAGNPVAAKKGILRLQLVLCVHHLKTCVERTSTASHPSDFACLTTSNSMLRLICYVRRHKGSSGSLWS